MIDILIVHVLDALVVSFHTDQPHIFRSALADFKARVPPGCRRYHRSAQAWVLRHGAADYLGAFCTEMRTAYGARVEHINALRPNGQ